MDLIAASNPVSVALRAANFASRETRASSTIYQVVKLAKKGRGQKAGVLVALRTVPRWS